MHGCKGMHLYKLILKLSRHALLAHTRYKIKLPNSLIMHWSHDKLQIQTHSSCFTCTHELQIQTHSLCFNCTHELQIERKKACHCNYPLMIFAMTNNRTIKNFWRSNFLFIGQLLLTIESKQLDISYMSTTSTNNTL